MWGLLVLSPRNAEVPNGQPIQKVAFNMEELFRVCRTAGLTNRTSTAGSIQVIHRYADEFLDLAQCIDLAMNPRTVEHFADARQRIDSDEAVDFFSLPHRSWRTPSKFR